MKLTEEQTAVITQLSDKLGAVVKKHTDGKTVAHAHGAVTFRSAHTEVNVNIQIGTETS